MSAYYVLKLPAVIIHSRLNSCYIKGGMNYGYSKQPIYKPTN